MDMPELRTQYEIVCFIVAVKETTMQYSGWISRMFDAAHHGREAGYVICRRHANDMWRAQFTKTEKENIIAHLVRRRLEQ